MVKLKVPKFIEGLTKKEVKKIIKYINSNKYDYKEINIENCTKEEDLILIKINNELKKMDIYSRIKFNITFERDLELIEFDVNLFWNIAVPKEDISPLNIVLPLNSLFPKAILLLLSLNELKSYASRTSTSLEVIELT